MPNFTFSHLVSFRARSFSFFRKSALESDSACTLQRSSIIDFSFGEQTFKNEIAVSVIAFYLFVYKHSSEIVAG